MTAAHALFLPSRFNSYTLGKVSSYVSFAYHSQTHLAVLSTFVPLPHRVLTAGPFLSSNPYYEYIYITQVLDSSIDKMTYFDGGMSSLYDQMDMGFNDIDGLVDDTGITFYTCGANHRPRRGDLPCPIIYEIDCREMVPPPELCEYMTGQHPQFKRRFFRNPHNIGILRKQIRRLVRELHRWRGSPCAVVVFCEMGVHRSVAIAEELAEIAGVKEVVHLDMEKNFAEYSERMRLERMGLRAPRRR